MALNESSQVGGSIGGKVTLALCLVCNATALIQGQLERQLKYAGQAARLEAVVIAREEYAWEESDERGAAGKLIDLVSAQLAEQPARVRYLPEARLAILEATPRYLLEILKSEALEVASTASARAYES